MKKFLKILFIGNLKTNLIMVLLITPYFLYCLYPDLNFEFCESHDRVKICSHEKIDVTSTAEQIRAMLSESEIYDPSLSLSIYITQSHNEYRIFAPIQKKSFALYQPFSRNIYINKTDLSTKKVSRSTDERHRGLIPTVVHEATHKMIYNKLGFFKSFMLPTWVSEGYPDFITNESTYSVEAAALLIEEQTIEDNPSAMYRVYLETVKYLFEEKGYDFQMLINHKGEWSQLKNTVFKRILKNKKRPST